MWNVSKISFYSFIFFCYFLSELIIYLIYGFKFLFLVPMISLTFFLFSFIVITSLINLTFLSGVEFLKNLSNSSLWFLTLSSFSSSPFYLCYFSYFFYYTMFRKPVLIFSLHYSLFSAAILSSCILSASFSSSFFSISMPFYYLFYSDLFSSLSS